MLLAFFAMLFAALFFVALAYAILTDYDWALALAERDEARLERDAARQAVATLKAAIKLTESARRKAAKAKQQKNDRLLVDDLIEEINESLGG